MITIIIIVQALIIAAIVLLYICHYDLVKSQEILLQSLKDQQRWNDLTHERLNILTEELGFKVRR